MVLCLAAALSSAGCQYFDRVGECRSLAGLVNPGLSAIDRQRRQYPESAIVHRDIASRYEALANAVSRLPLRTKRIMDASLEYQKLLRDAAHDSRTFADALSARNPERIAAARAVATRTVKREAGLVARLDGMCRGK